MSAWTKKPCQECGKKKGSKQVHQKYCYTCRREKDKERSTKQHSDGLLKKYGITAEQYQALYEFQGGVCYLCRRAKGSTRRLTVDHDHACCPDTPACGRCVRGLLCRGCNRNVLGWAAHDDIEFFRRGIAYLTRPPFAAILEAEELANGAANGRPRGGCTSGFRRNVRT